MGTGTISYRIDLDKVRMRNEIRQQIVNKLSDKEYRDIFVSEQINTGLAFQIQAMREQRGWTQAQLGENAGMAQSRISVMEDANYSRFSLNTLKRLASAFDVALVVRFEPFSDLVEHFVNLDSSSLNVPAFQSDSFVHAPIIDNAFTSLNSELVSGTVGIGEPYVHSSLDIYNLNLVGAREKTITGPIYDVGYTEKFPFLTNAVPAERAKVAA